MKTNNDLSGLDEEFIYAIKRYHEDCSELGLDKDDFETHLIEIIDKATDGEVELCR